MIRAIFSAVLLLLSACGGGGSGSSSPEVLQGPTPMQPPVSTPSPQSAPDAFFATRQSTARFLSRATFGATPADLNALAGTNAADWFVAQLSEPVSLVLPRMAEYEQFYSDDELGGFSGETSTMAYWRNIFTGPDQLRQRIAYALSQILVVSNGGGELLTDVPTGVAYYMDLLTRGALGNYRDLLEVVTYAPAMGHFLTYQGNEKGDPATGRVPDENYARELLQLFSIGTVLLNADGTVQRDGAGEAIEAYSNDDVTGLARVFTGLDFGEGPEGEDDALAIAIARPMDRYPERHSELEKRFLGAAIPSGTGIESSISQALDVIFAHPNVPPFIGRQLIQRLVTSHPEPAYVGRVAAAFDTGRYELPNGVVVGDGRRGDLAATVASVLFDEAAHPESPAPTFGKVREPILRFAHWVRTYVTDPAPEYVLALWDTTEGLSQHPYRARSVFNFYRPGYVAPGTATGALNLTMPELQIVNAASMPAYANFMTYFAAWREPEEELEELAEVFAEDSVLLDPANARSSFVPDYEEELAVAGQVDALVDLLDQKLTLGALGAGTRSNLVAILAAIPADDADARLERVRLAVVLITTSTEFQQQQ